jgi:hypothetical protein
MSAAGYDPSSELVLRGTVSESRDGFLKVRLPFGVVRIEVGQAMSDFAIGLGQTVEVTACKRQNDQGQWFVAREVCTAAGTIVLRDPRGVPVN